MPSDIESALLVCYTSDNLLQIRREEMLMMENQRILKVDPQRGDRLDLRETKLVCTSYC